MTLTDNNCRLIGTYAVKIGGTITTDEMVAIWKELGGSTNDYITQECYPLEPHPEEEVDILIFDTDSGFDEESVLEYLTASHLERPTHEHALRFAERHGKTRDIPKWTVYFYHEATPEPNGTRLIICVCCCFPRFSHKLQLLGADWPITKDAGVFAAVRRRK